MKYPSNTLPGAKLWLHLGQAATLASGVSRDLLSKLRSGLSAVLSHVQTAKMESVLNQMSDKELANIGITRSGIKRHAQFLLSYEYDGL
jgi:uncharacterized protein YjiS (DUF1127 family)